MAAGDATRVWFKEVDAILVSRWTGAMSGAELAALAADLTVNMTRFREQQGILPPTIHCPRCQTSARARPPVIHGGSVIFAARRLGLIGDTEVLTHPSDVAPVFGATKASGSDAGPGRGLSGAKTIRQARRMSLTGFW